MAQFWIDVADLTDLTDFICARGTNGTFDAPGVWMSFFTDASFSDTKGFYVPSANDNTIAYTPAGVVTDFEIMTYVRAEGTSTGGQRIAGPAGRIDTTVAGNMYLFGSSNSDGGQRGLDVRIGSTRTRLVTLEGYDNHSTAYRWHGLKGSGSLLHYASWSGARTDFPGWSSGVSDSTYSGPGYVGVGTYGNTRARYYSILAIGTDGDPAPIGPGGGGSSRRRSSLIWTPF